MMTAPSLSGILFSTWLSRWPRGMKTVPGIIPCSNSSSSRTSRNVASPTRGSASAGWISRISDFVCFSSSRKLAITTPRYPRRKDTFPTALSGLNPTAAVGYSQRSYPRDQGRQGLAQAVAHDGVRERIERCLLGIEDDEACPVAQRDLGQGRGRVDGE